MTIQRRLWRSCSPRSGDAVSRHFKRFLKAPAISFVTKASTYYAPLAVLSLIFSAIGWATSSGFAKGVN